MVRDALPVLDLADLDGGPAARLRFREALRTATHEVGFFHLRHHIEPEVIAELFDVARRFFALPEEDKRAVEMTRSPYFRGWTRLDGELTQGQVDHREQIDLGSEVAANDVVDPPYMRLDGPNQWPDALPELRPVILAWLERLEALGHRLLTEWALSLGAPSDHFAGTFDPASLMLKIVRYPGERGEDPGRRRPQRPGHPHPPARRARQGRPAGAHR